MNLHDSIDESLERIYNSLSPEEKSVADDRNSIYAIVRYGNCYNWRFYLAGRAGKETVQKDVQEVIELASELNSRESISALLTTVGVGSVEALVAELKRLHDLLPERVAGHSPELIQLMGMMVAMREMSEEIFESTR